jgi:5,10-methylenetetrahydromethanopterin reductase
MNIGFAHVPAWSFRDSLDLMVGAEAWGYDTAWLPDQAFYLDPYPLLTATALATKRLRLGVGVTNPFAVHPVISARTAATIADAADGRMVLGLGVGNTGDYLRPLGYTAERGAERCRDAVIVARGLLHGETVQLRGEDVVADGVRLSVPPRTRVPVYLAGIGKRALEYAGEYADGAIVNSASPSAVERCLEHVARGRARRDVTIGNDLELVAWGYADVTDDRAASLDRYRGRVAYAIHRYPLAALRTLGFADDAVAEIRQAYRDCGREGATPLISDEMVDRWVWIGRAEEIAERMQPLAQLGVTETVIVAWSHELEHVRTTVRAFAERGAPRLRT